MEHIILSNKLILDDKGIYFKNGDFLKNLFTHFICFCLLIASFPLLPTKVYANSCTSDEAKADLENCDGDLEDNPALIWNDEKCACENNNNVEGYQADFESCSDPSNGLDSTEQSYCYLNNGIEAAGISTCGGFIEELGSVTTDDDGDTDTTDQEAVESCMNSVGILMLKCSPTELPF